MAAVLKNGWAVNGSPYENLEDAIAAAKSAAENSDAGFPDTPIIQTTYAHWEAE